MSRYQGRHRASTPTPPAWRNTRIVVPVLAAATVTVTAAGVAQAAGRDPVPGTAAGAQVTAPDRAGSRQLSRSGDREGVGSRSASGRVAASAPATSDPAAAQRSAALSALGQTATARDLKQTWTCPISGCHGTLTSGFGHRASPGGIGSTNHLGDDFAMPIGTPLHAMHDGTVTKVGWSGGQGMRIEVDFGDGVSAVYAHLSAAKVSVGQHVAAADVIAYSGNTGNSTGAHLHLEVHLGGTPVDPAPWLTAHGIR